MRGRGLAHLCLPSLVHHSQDLSLGPSRVIWIFRFCLSSAAATSLSPSGLKVSHVCLMVLLPPPDRWRAGSSSAAHADSRLLPWQQPEAAGRVVVVDGRYGAAEPPLLVPRPVPGAWMGDLEPQFISESASQFDGAIRDGAGAGAHFEAAAAAPTFIDFLGVGAT
jgi:hypothetical protein